MSTATAEPVTCTTDALNCLLQGELAAVETYTQALGEFDDQEMIADLQKIRDDHSRAVRELRDHVIASGNSPADNSPGTWCAFTAATSETTRAVCSATVLAALRQGEEHGRNTYTDALENGEIRSECHQLIRTNLLPACNRHVEELNQLLGGNHI